MLSKRWNNKSRPFVDDNTCYGCRLPFRIRGFLSGPREPPLASFELPHLIPFSSCDSVLASLPLLVNSRLENRGESLPRDSTKDNILFIMIKT